MELQTQTLNESIIKQLQIIAISTDILILMKNRIEMIDYLLDGNDNNALLVEGDVSNIFYLIEKCYEAREKKIPVRLNIDGKILIFK